MFRIFIKMTILIHIPYFYSCPLWRQDRILNSNVLLRLLVWSAHYCFTPATGFDLNILLHILSLRPPHSHLHFHYKTWFSSQWMPSVMCLCFIITQSLSEFYYLHFILSSLFISATLSQYASPVMEIVLELDNVSSDLWHKRLDMICWSQSSSSQVQSN